MTTTTNNQRPQVHLFTDGACLGNPGPGGWGFILKHPASGRCKEGSGGEHDTTNNRMEIMGVICGLEALNRPSTVALFSDSQYVVKAITSWIAKWKRFGWRRTINSRVFVKNADLWQRLDELLQVHDVAANWVRGHDGHRENERCDYLAETAAARIKTTPRPLNPSAVVKTNASLFASAKEVG